MAMSRNKSIYIKVENKYYCVNNAYEIFCDKLIKFSDNGCQDHYEPAGDLCIRPSVYPETYDNAQLKCQSEGGSLLFITSQEVQVG